MDRTTASQHAQGRASAPARRRPSAVAALLTLLVAAGPVAADAVTPLLGRVSHVTDGDTLTVIVDDVRHRVRLGEIDAPEHDQPGSRDARQALAGKVADKYVRVDVETVDDYRRTVGKVWLGNRDINRELVREGHAWVYRHYLKDASLLDDEAAARAAKRGVWALADPVPPWSWRHGGRNAAAASGGGPAGDCVIKGNINSRDERIFHQPGDRHYVQTRISTKRGERWFCTVAEAERAGWRAAR